MKPTLYLETTIVSYLTARPSRDLTVAAHQEITRHWWELRDKFSLFISEAVLAESNRGDPEAASRRLGVLFDIPILDAEPEGNVLARFLIEEGAMDERAAVDAAHVSIATANGMDYLVTWNLKHIAAAGVRVKIERACRSQGYEPPTICTPEELMEP